MATCPCCETCCNIGGGPSALTATITDQSGCKACLVGLSTVITTVGAVGCFNDWTGTIDIGSCGTPGGINLKLRCDICLDKFTIIGTDCHAGIGIQAVDFVPIDPSMTVICSPLQIVFDIFFKGCSVPCGTPPCCPSGGFIEVTITA